MPMDRWIWHINMLGKLLVRALIFQSALVKCGNWIIGHVSYKLPWSSDAGNVKEFMGSGFFFILGAGKNVKCIVWITY